MSDETDIYNSSDPGGGGGDQGVKILNNFKLSQGSSEALNPLVINDGVMSMGHNACQFSPLNAFDISNAKNLKVDFRIKVNDEKYYDYFLSNWYGLGNAFTRVKLQITDSVVRIPDLFTAISSTSITSRGGGGSFNGSGFVGVFHDFEFEFDLLNEKFAFRFDEQESIRSCVYPYKGLWAPGFGCDHQGLNVKGVLAGTDVDLKQVRFKIDGSTVWGNEE